MSFNSNMPANAEHKTEPPVIEVKNLVKEYRLGALEGLRSIGRRMLGRGNPERKRFLALDDVSFNIHRGEVVGIIGHNGAGKSTLLKHLCRITTPTSGSVTVRGRIAPLIEVGAGLVGDMTGRENIYLNATILGLTRKEIDSKIDEIIEFAELEKFIDTPIKRYSSGMQARLGFSIATSVDTEILIVDEVLSVGDLAFQKKCFERMDHLIKHDGRTVLLVSHNLRQIERICSRAILLDQGRLINDDSSDLVCEDLYQKMATKSFESTAIGRRVEASGEVELLNITVHGNHESDEIYSGESLTVTVTIRSSVTLRSPSVIIGTHTPDYIYVSASYTGEEAHRQDIPIGISKFQYRYKSYPVTNGVYMTRLSIYDYNHRPVLVGEGLSAFLVKSRVAENNKAGMRLLELEGEWL